MKVIETNIFRIAEVTIWRTHWYYGSGFRTFLIEVEDDEERTWKDIADELAEKAMDTFTVDAVLVEIKHLGCKLEGDKVVDIVVTDEFDYGYNDYEG